MSNQGRTIEEVVTANNLQVIEDIKLEGVSGSIPALRDDIESIIALKKQHPSIRLVVVPDTSRFTRVGAHHGQKLLYDLEAVGIFVYFAFEDITNDSRISKIYLSFLFDSANQQARLIARNGTMGSEGSFLKGNSPHTRTTPYGLDRLYLVDDKPQHIIRNLPDGTQQMLDCENGSVIRTFGRNSKKGVPEHYIKQKSERILLIPGDPAHVAIVMTIFMLKYVERLSVRAITRELNDQGIKSPTGAEWHVDTVNKISLSAIYLGVGIRNKTKGGIYAVSSGKGEPLPSEVTLEDLVKEKPQPKRRTRDQWIEHPQPQLVNFLPENARIRAEVAIEAHHQREGMARPIQPNTNRHKNKTTYLATGLMRSKQGGHPMTGHSTPKKDGTPYKRYLVSRSLSVVKTKNEISGTIPAAAVDPVLLNLVREVVLQREGLREVLLRSVEAVKEDRSEAAEPAALRKEMAKRQKRIVALSRRLTDDTELDAPIEAGIDRLHNEVIDLTARLKFAEATVGAAVTDPSENVEALLEEFTQYVNTLDQNDPTAARGLVELLVGRLEACLKTKDVEIELSVPQSLARLLAGPKPVCLVSALACNSRHQAHHDDRLKIAVHRCKLRVEKSKKCYVCRRQAA